MKVRNLQFSVEKDEILQVSFFKYISVGQQFTHRLITHHPTHYLSNKITHAYCDIYWNV